MPFLLFLRHGQAKNNIEKILAGRTSGYPLTTTGIKQAKEIGDFLAPFDIKKIYCSPIERAEHTAKIVARKIDLSYEVDERLTEIDMGKLSGRKYSEVFSEHGNVFLKFYQGHSIETHGIETFENVKKRILDMVSFCSKKHDSENVLLVTHMDPIKSIIATILQPKPESLYELIIRNASLTILRTEQSILSMVSINSMFPSRYPQE